jgi:hypothetical protein
MSPVLTVLVALIGVLVESYVWPASATRSCGQWEAKARPERTSLSPRESPLTVAEQARVELAIDRAEVLWLGQRVLDEERKRRASSEAVVAFVGSRIPLSSDEELALRALIQPVVDDEYETGRGVDVARVLRSHRVGGKLCVILDERRCIRILKDPAL